MDTREQQRQEKLPLLSQNELNTPYNILETSAPLYIGSFADFKY